MLRSQGPLRGHRGSVERQTGHAAVGDSANVTNSASWWTLSLTRHEASGAEASRSAADLPVHLRSLGSSPRNAGPVSCGQEDAAGQSAAPILPVSSQAPGGLLAALSPSPRDTSLILARGHHPQPHDQGVPRKGQTGKRAVQGPVGTRAASCGAGRTVTVPPEGVWDNSRLPRAARWPSRPHHLTGLTQPSTSGDAR